MKKRASVLFLLNAALAAAAGLAFVNNVSVVARWGRAFREAGGDAAQMPERISGVMPAFDWAAVDYSCVSTFIPFFGFLLVAVGYLRIMLGRRCDAERFPFFRSYDQLNVALGLVGTLWGIIMIGYYDMETVTMANLMTCLHTALFSTLVAVVWVFLVEHPVILPLARGVLAQAGLVNDDDDKALDAVLDDLRAAAAGVGSVLQDEREAAMRFAESLDGAARGVAGFTAAAEGHAREVAECGRAVEALCRGQAEAMRAATDKALESIRQAAEAAFGKIAAASEEAGAKAADAAKAAAQSAAESARAAVAAMEEARKEAEASAARAFEERLKAMDAADLERRKKFAEALSLRLDAFEKAQLERESRFDEILDRRIARLSEESRGNAERADKAENALGRIRAALQ